MFFMMGFCLIMLVFGLAVVSSNPSPYYSALGLVIVAGVGCALLAYFGGPFFSLILFLIYLGGMLVVFGYSAALAADPFPESLGSINVLGLVVFFIFLAFFITFMVWDLPGGSLNLLMEGFIFSSAQNNTGGVALLYLHGAVMTTLGAFVLLLTLFVVLKLVWGSSYAVLRLV